MTADPSEIAANTRLTPAIWLATGLGVSRGVPAPGTVGAIWGIPLYLAIAQIPSHAGQIAAVVALVAIGIPLCTRAASDLVRLDPERDGKDPQEITWDEFSTVPIVYLCAPQACHCAVWIATGFALHRLFDITKPWPCNLLERLPRGWGIMLDDVMAALYAGACYALLWHFFS